MIKIPGEKCFHDDALEKDFVNKTKN